MRTYTLLLLVALAGCQSVPDSVDAAMDTRARIEGEAVDALVGVLDASLVELTDALYQWREAEHETRLRTEAAAGPLTVDGVLALRARYESVAEKNAALVAAFGAKVEAVRAKLEQAGALDARVRRVLDAIRERATATEGLASAAIEAARVAGEADAAKRAARAERKRREAEAAAAEEHE